MPAPTTDRGGITQALKALDEAGWQVYAVDGGEGRESVATVHNATETAMQFDEAWVFLRTREVDPKTGWVRFVMGNDPDEVICDYTVNLEHALGPLMDSWWS